MSSEEAVDLCIRALYEAADSDSATGGPDLLRRIFPVVAVIEADGFRRLDDTDLEARFRALLERLGTGGVEATPS